MRWMAIGIVLGVTFSAQATERPTIYDGVLAGGGENGLSTFAQLMNDVFGEEDLQRIFDGDAHYTVFAPSDAAFEDLFDTLSEEQLAEFQDLGSGALEQLLRYHVTQGDWHQPTGALRMLDDSVAHTYRDHDGASIDDARIVDRARYRNGVVATIDRVISPPDAPLPGPVSATATIHDNHLFFVGDALSVSGDFGKLVITAGQPFEGRSLEGDTLLIKAGRKKSAPPADYLKAGVTSDNMLPSVSGSEQPSKLRFTQQVTTLNLAVEGESFTCHDVRFAQGAGFFGVNWWLSQPGARRVDVGGNKTRFYLSCTAHGKAWCNLHFKSGGLNGRAYLVSKADC